MEMRPSGMGLRGPNRELGFQPRTPSNRGRASSLPSRATPAPVAMTLPARLCRLLLPALFAAAPLLAAESAPAARRLPPPGIEISAADRAGNDKGVTS